MVTWYAGIVEKDISIVFLKFNIKTLNFYFN